ncbi:MAG TPA: murein biosynthesis integral membrane protein MurJ [Candidatus Polarisedimenticolia bacterium]|nr:murein biosynthesis integral membrane protein MurJ [Candidatus Polarisedimenticolia bacterium]
MEETRRLVRSAGVMSLMTLLSRVLGYVRDNLQAQMLGASRTADAFIIAFRIPNLLRRLVGEGAFTAAFVPTLSDYTRPERRAELWRFAAVTFWTMACVLMVLSALGVIFSPWLVRLLAYGFAGIEEKFQLTVSLNRLMFPYLLFIGLAALVQGVLNVHGRFAVPAFTPVLLNLSIIGSALLLAPLTREPAYAFAWGVLLGGALQLGFQVPFVARLGMRFPLSTGFRDPGVRQIGRLMVPGLFGMGITQITMLLDSFFASLLREGSVSALYYSGRINELALGSFAISVSTVILPALSRQAAEGNIEAMRGTLLYGLRVVAFITLPASVGLMVLREPIVSVLFERGRFSAQDTAYAAHALLFYAVGLFPFGAVKILAPAFYSQKDTGTPMRAAGITLGAHVVLVTVLSFLMETGGIALADSLSASVNMALLMGIFARRHGLPWVRGLAGPAVRYLAAAALMGLAAKGAHAGLAAGLGSAPLAGPLSLIGALATGAGLYVLICWTMGSAELRDVAAALPLGGIRRRRR